MRLFHVEDPIGAHICESLNSTARPAQLNGGSTSFLAQSEVHAAVAGGHEADADRHVIIECSSGWRGDLDFCADRIPIAFVPRETKQEPVVSIVRGVQ